MAITAHLIKKPKAKHKRDGTRTYTSQYELLSDSATSNHGDLLNATGLPTLSSVFSYEGFTDNGAFLDEIDFEGADSEKTRLKWYATCNYTTAPFQGGGGVGIDPVDEPAKISGNFAQFTRLAERDKDGELLLNTAFERFRVEVDDSRIVLVIQKNLASVDFATWADYRDAVNTDTFWYLDARMWKVQNISPELARRGDGSFYFPTTFEFSANPDTWDYFGVSEGFRRRSLVTVTKNVVIEDENGQPLNSPKLLDVNGQPVDEGVTTIGTSAGQIYPIEKRIYRERPFAALGVPMNDSQL